MQIASAGINFTNTLQMDASATFDIGKVDDMVDGLTGAGTVDNSGSSAHILTIGDNNGGGTFSGDITESGTTGGTKIIKIGTGTEIFSGTTHYTGITAVSNGTLLVNGTLAATAVTVASGATFGGTGTAGGAVIYQSGAFATNILTISGGNNTTPLIVSGALTMTNTTFYVNYSGVIPEGTYNLINAGSVAGSSTVNQSPTLTGGGSLAANDTAKVSISGAHVVLTVTCGGPTATVRGGTARPFAAATARRSMRT